MIRYSRPERSRVSMWSKSPWRRAAPGRWHCPAIMHATTRILLNMRVLPPRLTDLSIISTATFMIAERPDGEFRTEELLADVMSRLIGDVRHVAVGAQSPVPAAAAMLARMRGGGRPYVSILESRTHNFFTDGGRELFDCAGQGRLDVFSSPAGRSTARPTSISSASGITAGRRCGSPARSARPIFILSCRA